MSSSFKPKGSSFPLKYTFWGIFPFNSSFFTISFFFSLTFSFGLSLTSFLISSFLGLDSTFQKSFVTQKQVDVLFKKLDILETFGLDVYFGPAEAETCMRDFALDAIFAYKVRLPELWLDENGKLVLNISKPYTWVGT